MTTDLYAQAAVIPYRFDKNGRLEVLLIRRVDKEKWGIPKGMVDMGLSLEQTARTEAMEEAGVEGDLSDKPIGYFAFKKWNGLCHVTVYLLHVTEVQEEYPEKNRRERQWFPLTTAAELARRKKVRQLILELPNLIKGHAC